MRPARPLAALVAISAVYALTFPHGSPPFAWLVWVTLALLVTVPLAELETPWLAGWVIPAGTAAALLLESSDRTTLLANLFTRWPREQVVAVQAGLLVLGLVAILPVPARWRSVSTGALILLSAGFLGLAVLQLRSGAPYIDVYEMHLEALDRFWSGASPYAGTFRNIYPHDDWYGAGLVVGGRVQIGYAYPPLTFLVAALGDYCGDFRVGFAVASVAAAWLLAAIGGHGARCGAVLFLLYPQHFWVVNQAWTEPVFVCGVAGVLYAAMRHPRWLWLALGLLWGSKQYAVLMLPLVPLLVAGGDWRAIVRQLLLSFALAAAYFVPFFAWHPVGFFRSVVMYQIWQPFRFDGMGFLAWWAARGHGALGNGITFLALAVGLGVALWRSPRNAVGFSAGAALVLFLLFAFAKQAFLNYYYCCVGLLCGLVSTSSGGPRGQT
jgi:hypothetical protein